MPIDYQQSPSAEIPSLHCPLCYLALTCSAATLRCPGCGATFPVCDGIPSFVTEDAFYEHRYDEVRPIRFMPDSRNPLHRLLLYLVCQHYLWYIHKYFEQPGVVLDVACGGGTRYLASRHSAIGLDISLANLQRLDSSYVRAVRASAFQVPYPDASFEYIVSKCFFEHVPTEAMSLLLAEWKRLLKPSGRLVLLFDTESTNPLWLWAKRDRELFQRSFLDRDGHVGLMLPSRALSMLRDGGFEILAYHGTNKTWAVYLSMLQWLRDYRGASPLLDTVLTVSDYVVKRRLLTMAYEFAVTVWDDIVEPFLDLDRSRYLLVACEKR